MSAAGNVTRGLIVVACVVLLALLVRGAYLPANDGVVVYAALDREFSETIFSQFTAETKVPVRAKYDAESTKTVGLVTALISERARPRCDVFWNNEILGTLRLVKQGLVEPYKSPAAEAFPPEFRAADGSWCGFAARARVLIVNTDLVTEAARPAGIEDLASEKWRGKSAIAKPLFGTTATHAACLFATWGDERAAAFFRRLKANRIQVMAGNKQVARAVADGSAAFGLTDTDDAIIEVERGMPVAIVYPDQAPHGDPSTAELGTLFIPNTVALIRGAPHPDAARKLIDYLLTPAVEQALALGPSAQIPLNPSVTIESRVATPRTVHPMNVDWNLAADCWEDAMKFLRAEFSGP